MTESPSSTRPIAITGGTGFVGGRLIDRALARGHRVRALTRRVQAPRPGLRWVAGDLADRAALGRLVEGCAAVYHCAGLVKARSRGEFEAVNVGGSRILAEAVRGTADEPHFILVSSLAAREPHLSAYARSKRGGEEVVCDILGAGRWTILRPPAVYGPGDMEILALVRLMERGFLPVLSGPDGRFSMIHGDDLAAALLALANEEAFYQRTAEIRDDAEAGYSAAEVAAAAGKILGRKVRPLPLPGPLLGVAAGVMHSASRFAGRPSILGFGKLRELRHPDWVAKSNDLAAQGLWRPRKTLESGLAETIAWYRQEGLLRPNPAR